MRLKTFFITLFTGFFLVLPLVHADAIDDLTGELENLQDAIESAQGDEYLELSAEYGLVERQLSVAENFDHLKNRIQAISGRDPRKDRANEILDEVEATVESFTIIKARSALIKSSLKSNLEFDQLERDAIAAISNANQFLLVPYNPGTPDGNLIEDFIPQMIRLLFRFTYLAVLISFIVSGVFFIASLSNEERLTKARQMLYYSLIGFALVTLAFAIVKAITDIDFFNFV